MYNVLETLKAQDYDTIPEDFYNLINVWKSWYDGNVAKFHTYRVYNGTDHITMRRYSMGMAKKVAEDWANLLMNEKVAYTLEGDAEQKFIDDIFSKNNFTVKCNQMQELKAAMGTVAYVPRIVGATVDSNTGEMIGTADRIHLDFVYGANVLPLSWDNGVVTECAFATSHVSENEKYVYIQIHKKAANGNYDIENHLYNAENELLGEVDLDSVDAFANIPKVVHTGSDKPQFVIDTLNIVNNFDPSLPMGVAAYANAIDQLKACDIAYDSYVNEFVLGKKRILVKPEATTDFDGNPLFDPDELVFYTLPEDSQAGSTVQEINMELRASQHNAALQDMLNTLSAKCGFGEQHYKFNQGSVATATQIISENSTLFRTIKKHEIILERVLTDLMRMLLRLGNQYMGAGLNEDVEISIDFDDSIIEDKATEFQRDAMMLQYGILNPYEFRMTWMNEDEETAKKALPQMTQMAEDDQLMQQQQQQMLGMGEE